MTKRGWIFLLMGIIFGAGAVMVSPMGWLALVLAPVLVGFIIALFLPVAWLQIVERQSNKD